MPFDPDLLVVTPEHVDLRRSPLRASLDRLGEETYVLGAFNPGLTRLPNGNLLLMVRVAEALREAERGGHIRALRWAGPNEYVLDAYPRELIDMRDPRKFQLATHFYKSMALTSLSWLLPIEMSADGCEIVRIHYDKAIAPAASYQHYGVEDARISLIDGTYYMTACSVSAERHATSLYTSRNGLDYDLQGLVLDHQNKDMLYFEGRIGGRFWALTRPMGDLYFLYPPESGLHAGPSINLAVSPDGLHWKPHEAPFIRPRRESLMTMKVGGGAPPIRTPRGWLILYHGVAPLGVVGVYRTFWALADLDHPARLLINDDMNPLLEARPDLTQPLAERMYVDNVVFTTGVIDAGENYILASGEADLACRITHVPKSVFA